MRGSKIILTANPLGRYAEGTITDTSKPGTHMEVVPATAMNSGRLSYRACSATTGAKGPRIILLPNWMLGKTYSDAYAANERCYLYFPNAGDELNLLLGDVGGTADTVAIGDKFAVASTGKIIRNSTNTSAPYESMEALAAASADELVAVTYLGDQA